MERAFDTPEGRGDRPERRPAGAEGAAAPGLPTLPASPLAGYGWRLAWLEPGSGPLARGQRLPSLVLMPEQLPTGRPGTRQVVLRLLGALQAEATALPCARWLFVQAAEAEGEAGPPLEPLTTGETAPGWGRPLEGFFGDWLLSASGLPAPPLRWLTAAEAARLLLSLRQAAHGQE
ncbi:hypothetical protein [Thermogemmatispora sp.]|uniref:hypothetical protein n=1 Tax=Thermogemmatispora sp. TaxID=1968838 RepID=UPI0035E40E6B